MGDPDEELLARVASGDPASVRALVARKLPRLLSLAGRMLGDATAAEDVAQEVFLRVWKQAPRWRPGAARFDTWLHRVALNLCYDRLRRRRELSYAEPPDRPDEGPAPDRGLEARDTGRRVSAASHGVAHGRAAGRRGWYLGRHLSRSLSQRAGRQQSQRRE